MKLVNEFTCLNGKIDYAFAAPKTSFLFSQNKKVMNFDLAGNEYKRIFQNLMHGVQIVAYKL